MFYDSNSQELSFSENEVQNGLLCSETVKEYGYEQFQELGLLSQKGKVRLLPAQRYFNENENYLPLLPQLFETWRNESEYMVFKHEADGKTLHVAVKCSKRGNDVYVSRVKKRFRLFNQNIEETKFFSPGDLQVDKMVKTPLLWVTLTWDTRNYSIRQAWKVVGSQWNRWITAVRSRYGKVSVLRSWETSQRGYPHIHAVLSFESAKFTVFPHFNEKQGRMTFRIQEKHEFESLWHSYTDIEAISSTKKLAHYVMKYQLKVNEGRETEGSSGPGSGASSYNSKTLAFMWLFRKRSFSMSKGFQGLFSRLDRDLHNSNMEKEGAWELIGVFSGRELGLHGEWVAEVSEAVLRPLVRDGDSRVDQGMMRDSYVD